jgi:hypothetical protein
MEVAHSAQKGAFGLEMEGGGKEMIDAPMLKQVSLYGTLLVKCLIHQPGGEYYSDGKGSWLGNSWCKLNGNECITFKCSEWQVLDHLAQPTSKYPACIYPAVIFGKDDRTNWQARLLQIFILLFVIDPWHFWGNPLTF